MWKNLETVMAGIVAASSALLAQQGILSSRELTLACLVGSVGGALLTVALYPPPKTIKSTFRLNALRYVCSMIMGVIFTPGLLRWAEEHQWMNSNLESVLFASGTVAMCGLSVQEMLVKWVVARVKKLLDTAGLERAERSASALPDEPRRED